MKKIITMCLLLSLFSSLLAQRQLTIESQGSGNTVHIEALDNIITRDLLELELPSGATSEEQFIECQQGSTPVARINGDGSAEFRNKIDFNNGIGYMNINSAADGSLVSAIGGGLGALEIANYTNFTISDILLKTNGITRMKVEETGKVGIGDYNSGGAGYTLTVKHGNGTTGNGLQLLHNGSNSNSWELYTVNNDGRLLFLENGNEVKQLEEDGDFVDASDRRLKTNIDYMQDGYLARINQLKPATYRYKRLQHKAEKSIGLIAQEVQEVFPELVKKLNADETKKENYLGITYNAFIPILIKGMQEQQQIIEHQQANNNKLETEVADLKQQVAQLAALVERVAALENNLQSCCLKHQNGNESQLEHSMETIPQDRAQLQQNFPNPFHQNTEIQYYLPTNTKTANLQISDLNGKVLETYSLTGNGVGKVLLDGGQLAEGMYVYTLVVDGKLVDSKSMVLTK